MTAGESHGPALVGILEGMPAGVQVDRGRIDFELGRRQGGYGRGSRMRIERDAVEILAGVRHGYTLGSPIALLIRNRDWDNWSHIMSPDPPVSGSSPDTDHSRLRDKIGAGAGPDPGTAFGSRTLTRPRPGHADLAGGLKYGHRDLRNILERASARETAIRVAIGALCQCFLESLGVRLFSHVLAIGGVAADIEGLSLDQLRERAAASPVYCADPKATEAMIHAIDEAKQRGDTLGGVFEVVATGVPPGLGSHVSADRKLDGRLAAEIMSIQAIKGVEVGLGFLAAARFGSGVHDEILPSADPHKPWRRPSNRAGGIEGGMSNGEPIVVRAAMKPIATLYRPLTSIDIRSGEATAAGVERSDICAVPAASVVGQAAVAFVLAAAVIEKFGGDSLEELKRNMEGFLHSIPRYFQG